MVTWRVLKSPSTLFFLVHLWKHSDVFGSYHGRNSCMGFEPSATALSRQAHVVEWHGKGSKACRTVHHQDVCNPLLKKRQIYIKKSNENEIHLKREDGLESEVWKIETSFQLCIQHRFQDCKNVLQNYRIWAKHTSSVHFYHGISICSVGQNRWNIWLFLTFVVCSWQAESIS